MIVQYQTHEQNYPTMIPPEIHVVSLNYVITLTASSDSLQVIALTVIAPILTKLSYDTYIYLPGINSDTALCTLI